LYLDSSVVMAIVFREPGSAQLGRSILAAGGSCLVSSFALLEFYDAIARRARMGRMSAEERSILLAELDRWRKAFAETVDVLEGDIAEAAALLRPGHLKLRAQDAIHVAAARRLNCRLFTLDADMREAAHRLNLPTVA
jgi:hypothetical protein